MMDYEKMSDADLNRCFAREFLDRPIDERTNTYWHDDEKTPIVENQEWRPTPNYIDEWGRVRGLLKQSKTVIPVSFMPGVNRCRRAMIWLLRTREADARNENQQNKRVRRLTHAT